MRKLSLFLLFALSAMMLAGCQSQDKGILPSLTGEYHVITVFAPNEDKAGKLTNAFKSSPGLDEHDIAWIVIGPERITSNLDEPPSRKRLEKLHSVDGFQALVIGKDGSLVATQLGNLDIQALVDSILPKPDEGQTLPQQSSGSH